MLMDDEMDVDYLSNLPDEIKLLIFSYLNSFDRVTLLESISNNFKHLALDRRLVGNLNFYKEYRCSSAHIKHIFSNKLRSDIITSLNVNSLYWVARADLDSIRDLPMLECLYALDGPLNIQSILLSGLKKLHTLAISCPINISRTVWEQDLCLFKSLRKLCGHFVRLHVDRFEYYLMKFSNLEELWIINISKVELITDGMIKKYKNLKKFVVWDHSFTPDYEQFNTATFYCSREFCQMCVEKTDVGSCDIYDIDYYISETWRKYVELARPGNMPFGVSDSKKLVLKQCTIENINFEELHFRHEFAPGNYCNPFKSTVESILLLPNTKLLKKLAISMCFFHHKVKKDLCKQQKNVETLEKITEHCPLIEELEILDCKGHMSYKERQVSFHTWNCIKNWKHLRKLTIYDVPEDVNPSYLVEICQNCVNLESLKISSHCLNTSLNHYLCLALPHTKSLKDLSYDHKALPLDCLYPLMKSLVEMKPFKLRRVVLKCKRKAFTSLEPFNNFVDNNPQLHFFYLSIEGLDKIEFLREMVKRKIFNRSKQPMNILVPDDDFETYGHDFSLNIHIEMLRNKSQICTLDIFNGFTKYS